MSPTVVMKFDASSMQLSITEDDIARGYIDVPGTYRLTLTGDRTMQHLANITLDYEPNPYNFTSIQVASLTLQTGENNSDAMLALANGIDALPATAAGRSDELQTPMEGDRNVKTFESTNNVSARGSVTSLGYRLMLTEKIRAGNISVPLILGVQL